MSDELAAAYPRLGEIVSRVQSRFILAATPREVFDPLLTDLLEFTGSEYGFLAELVRDPTDGHTFLRILVLTDISWSDATREMYRAHSSGERLMEFHNLKTLFGVAVSSAATVIANDPGTDPRSGGLAAGHPAMLNFLGVPLFHGGELLGMVGLSNRPGGYQQALVDFLQPLFSSVGAILGAVRSERVRRAAEQALRDGQARMVAAEAAERANAAKTEFLSRMSHELRTPLNAVLGFAHLLSRDGQSPLTQRQLDWVQHIQDAGRHLLAMINDVLDLSRIESGSLVITLDTVELAEVVRQSLALLAPQAQEAGVNLRAEPPAPTPGGVTHVQADPLRLRQVLVNLLGNAIKYNRRGGEACLRWHADDAAGTVHIAISDDGQGLSAEQQAHLFEPFNRLGAESGQIEGTGIGLVVTLGLVRMMNGSLQVSSEAGRGSCFTVVLPSSVPADAAVAARPVPAAVAPTIRRRVLYAEDNPMNVALLEDVIQLRPAITLLVARSGAEALAALKAQPPDLLLLDMHLGDMTGLDVLQALSESPALAGVPCLVLSADATAATIAAAERAGVRAYLPKPLDIDHLLALLDRLLAER